MSRKSVYENNTPEYRFGKDNEWKFLTNMGGPREFPGAIAIPNGIWVSGGQPGGNSTEFIFLNGSRSDGPKLPKPVQGHCLVQHDGIVFSIGGLGETTEYSTVSIFSAKEGMKHIADGPDLNKARYFLGCGIFNR